jgi:hypothetical protein
MIKKLITPFQKVLLEKNLCVGCTHPLNRIHKLGNISEHKEMMQCKCKRRYIFDKELGTYRRATFEEEILFLEQKKK